MLRHAPKICALALSLAGTAPTARADLVGFDPATTALNQNNSHGTTGLASIGGGGTTLTLTDGQPWESRSAFATSQQSVTGFQVQFDYHATGYDPYVGGADGIAFVLQVDPRGPGAVGGVGLGLGYGDGDNGGVITRSVAFELNILNAWNRYSAGTALVYGGSTGSYVSNGLINVEGGDPIRVTLAYDGTTVTETLHDLTTLATFTTSVVADIPTLLGSSTAYVGFTGATGAMTSIQTISNFTYSTPVLAPSPVPEPASLALMGIAMPVVLGVVRRRRNRRIG